MKNFLFALPSILLIGFANAILKWRSTLLSKQGIEMFSGKAIDFLLDPFIFAGAMATAISVLWWLRIVSIVPVSIVYPMIQGGAIIVTLLLASLFLSESIVAAQFFGITFVIIGITLLSLA